MVGEVRGNFVLSVPPSPGPPVSLTFAARSRSHFAFVKCVLYINTEDQLGQSLSPAKCSVCLKLPLGICHGRACAIEVIISFVICCQMKTSRSLPKDIQYLSIRPRKIAFFFKNGAQRSHKRLWTTEWPFALQTEIKVCWSYSSLHLTVFREQFQVNFTPFRLNKHLTYNLST